MSARLEGLCGAAAERERSCLLGHVWAEPLLRAPSERVMFPHGSHPQVPAAGTWVMENVVLHKRQ